MKDFERGETEKMTEAFKWVNLGTVDEVLRKASHHEYHNLLISAPYTYDQKFHPKRIKGLPRLYDLEAEVK